jgi:hypothetical protein
MGLFDRLGEFGKEVGGALVASPKFVWDVATAPWNDDEDFNGFKNTIKSASTNFGESIIAPIATIADAPIIKPVLKAIDTVNREVIREPLTNLFMLDKVQGDSFSEKWRNAEELNKRVSFGQAAVSQIGDVIPGQQAVDKLDWRSDDEVKAFYSSGAAQFFSGFADATIQVFGDLTIVGGKAAIVAKGSKFATNALTGERAAEAIIEMNKAATGVEVNKYTELAKEIVANDEIYWMNNKMVMSANPAARSTLANTFGKIDNEQDAFLAMRVAVGDPKAFEMLKEKGRFDLADPLNRANGNSDAYQQWQVTQATREDGMLDFTWDNDSLFQETNAYHESLLAHDPAFTSWWSDLEEFAGAPLLSRTVGSSTAIRALEDFAAKGRSSKFYDRQVGDAKGDYFQPTPFHRMYQKFSWASGERPQGIINLNDADSTREVTAVLQRAIKLSDGNITTDDARRYMTDMLAAQTPEARAAVVGTIELVTVRAIANKYGYSYEKAEEFYSEFTRARQTAVSSLQKNNYIIDVDNSIIRVPIFESQTANNLPMMDFDLLNRLLKERSAFDKGKGRGLTRSLASDSISVLDATQSFFKASVLLRLGYTIRNGVEAQLRIASSVGAMASMRHLGPGMWNLMRNTADATGNRSIDLVTRRGKGMKYGEVSSEYNKVIADLTDVDAKIAKLSTRLEQNPGDTQTITDLDLLNQLRDDKITIRDAYSRRLASLEEEVARTGKRRIGSGEIKIRSRYQVNDMDGKSYTFDDGFGDDIADLHRMDASSSSTYTTLVDNQTKSLQGNLVGAGYGTVKPTDSNYWVEWARAINNDFGNSAVAVKLAKGETPEQVASWLRGTREGARLRKRLKMEPSQADEYVLTVRGLLDRHVVDDELKSMLATGENVTPELLRNKAQTLETLPDISGQILKENMELLTQNHIASAVNGAFRLIGSMPEDAWARFPLYLSMYRKSLQDRVTGFEGVKQGVLTPAEQNVLRKLAHADALEFVRKTLFTIDRKSNLASIGLVRLSMPFFPAVENSVKTWAKLAANKPQIINRANLIWTSPNRAGFATDQEGNPVATEDATMDDYMWIQLPDKMKNAPGLKILNNVGIQKKNLDVIFQGELALPVGPYVAVPVSELVKRKPEFEQTMKWAIPYGPERNAALALLPTWAKRQITRVQGQDNVQYANTYTLMWQTEQYKRKINGESPATAAEIKAQVDAFYNMRSVANLILPFAPQFASPYKMYIDQYRAYQEKFGIEADAKWLEAMGEDFFDFTMSLSKNTAGSAATVSDVQSAKKYSSLIASVVEDEPKLVGLITATGRGEYEFSQAAYMWQQENTLSPTSTTPFRDRNDPATAEKKTNAEKGWIYFGQLMDGIDAEMQNRGLTSLRSKEAADLAEAKKAFITQYGAQNQDWYDDYLDTDGSKTNRVIRGFEKILNDETFMADHGDNPTWKAMAVYLEVRSAVGQELLNRGGLKKGSSTLTSKSNDDLEDAMTQLTNQLKAQDIVFGDIYNRYLSRDPIYDVVYTNMEN